MEYSKVFNKAIKKKVIIPINNGLRHNIGILKSNKNTKYPETICLLSQAYKSLNNAENLLRTGSIVDSCNLLRSSFEYMMLGFNIQFNDNTYKELINLTISGKDRDDTRPSRLITEFRKHLNKFSMDLFKDINRDEKKQMLQELYDKMCYFTHGSLMVTSISSIEKHKVKEIYILLSKINIYIMKLILVLGLAYLNNDSKYYISGDSLYLGYLITVIKISELINSCKEDMTMINSYLHLDKNSEYLDKTIKESNALKDIFIQNKEYIENNPNQLIEMLKEFLS